MSCRWHDCGDVHEVQIGSQQLSAAADGDGGGHAVDATPWRHSCGSTASVDLRRSLEVGDREAGGSSYSRLRCRRRYFPLQGDYWRGAGKRHSPGLVRASWRRDDRVGRSARPWRPAPRRVSWWIKLRIARLPGRLRPNGSLRSRSEQERLEDGRRERASSSERLGEDRFHRRPLDAPSLLVGIGHNP